MKIRVPTSREIEELVGFLPKLTADGFNPIRRWHGGTKDEGELATMPWPEYEEHVVEFFRIASSECWSDHGYRPVDAGRMLSDADVVKNADLAKIKTMLTFCVRGERFCDGHWGAMIEEGHIERLLQRLAELKRGND